MFHIYIYINKKHEHATKEPYLEVQFRIPFSMHKQIHMSRPRHLISDAHELAKNLNRVNNIRPGDS